jgi:bifunctional DNA-binding transcriptional regulator/antitoxin component of YhaV-PrlF toxin-antitoxin module
MSNILQIRKKGSLTLPISLRNKYQINEGDTFTIIDLEDGSFLLSPRASRVNQLGDRVESILAQSQLSTDDLIAALDDERESYYRDHYVQP